MILREKKNLSSILINQWNLLERPWVSHEISVSQIMIARAVKQSRTYLSELACLQKLKLLQNLYKNNHKWFSRKKNWVLF